MRNADLLNTPLIFYYYYGRSFVVTYYKEDFSMTKIIQPIFETKNEDILASTKHRFFTMFAPIQACKYKDILGRDKTKTSDLTAYILAPVIDSILEPMFAIDSIIHSLNASVSACNALYIWSLKQQNTNDIIDADSKKEFDFAWSSIAHSISMDIAQALNVIFSLISLITRPISSAVKLGIDMTNQCETFVFSH